MKRTSKRLIPTFSNWKSFSQYQWYIMDNIPDIFILSPHDKDFKWIESEIKHKFCNNGQFGRLNGVGFFINPDDGDNDKNVFGRQLSCEFALCSTKNLNYVKTYECRGPRQLSSTGYKFSGSEPIYAIDKKK